MTAMTACGKCEEPVAIHDRFCEACGFDLCVRRGGTAGAARSVSRCHGCGQSGTGEYCPDCGLRYSDGSDRVEIDLGWLAGVSDRGYVHAHNEDALALGVRGAEGAADVLGAVVCDGVSSTPGSDRAARAAAESALDVLLRERAPETAPTATARVREGVAAAAHAVAALAAAGDDDPSCTIVTAFVDHSDPARPEVAVGWLGDSRAYWLAEPLATEQARVLTGDHSWAAEMLAKHDVDEASVLADRRANMITRWLSADDDPEVVLLHPEEAGTLLLCTDGLWNYASAAADLTATAAAASGIGTSGDESGEALRSAVELTSVALRGGAHDNVTVAVVPITPRSAI